MPVRRAVSNRLLPAVQGGLVEALGPFGFTASGGGGSRGEVVECTNGSTLIVVTADWLEGELSLTVKPAGGPAVAIGDVIDLAQIRGLHLSRLPKSVSIETVAQQLRKVAEALSQQAPELLSSDG